MAEHVQRKLLQIKRKSNIAHTPQRTDMDFAVALKVIQSTVRVCCDCVPLTVCVCVCALC